MKNNASNIKTMIRITSLEDLCANAEKIPTNALNDINTRISDWLECEGTSLSDSYILKEFSFAEKLINHINWIYDIISVKSYYKYIHEIIKDIINYCFTNVNKCSIILLKVRR